LGATATVHRVHDNPQLLLADLLEIDDLLHGRDVRGARIVDFDAPVLNAFLEVDRADGQPVHASFHLRANLRIGRPGVMCLELVAVELGRIMAGRDHDRAAKRPVAHRECHRRGRHR